MTIMICNKMNIRKSIAICKRHKSNFKMGRIHEIIAENNVDALVEYCERIGARSKLEDIVPYALCQACLAGRKECVSAVLRLATERSIVISNDALCASATYCARRKCRFARAAVAVASSSARALLVGGVIRNSSGCRGGCC